MKIHNPNWLIILIIPLVLGALACSEKPENKDSKSSSELGKGNEAWLANPEVFITKRAGEHQDHELIQAVQ